MNTHEHSRPVEIITTILITLPVEIVSTGFARPAIAVKLVA